MKQKIVIEVCMSDHKSRSKAMKIAVGVSGVESAAITGQEKNQVEVVGDGIDAVVLTMLIRKNVAYAEIVSVGEAKKEEAAAENKPETVVAAPPPVVWTFPPAPPSYYDGHWNYPHVHDVRDPRNDPSCNIM